MQYLKQTILKNFCCYLTFVFYWVPGILSGNPICHPSSSFSWDHQTARHVLGMEKAEAQDQVSPVVSAFFKTLLVFPMPVSLAKTSNMVQRWRSVCHPLKEHMDMTKDVGSGRIRKSGPLTQSAKRGWIGFNLSWVIPYKKQVPGVEYDWPSFSHTPTLWPKENGSLDWQSWKTNGSWMRSGFSKESQSILPDRKRHRFWAGETVYVYPACVPDFAHMSTSGKTLEMLLSCKREEGMNWNIQNWTKYTGSFKYTKIREDPTDLVERVSKGSTERVRRYNKILSGRGRVTVSKFYLMLIHCTIEGIHVSQGT